MLLLSHFSLHISATTGYL